MLTLAAQEETIPVESPLQTATHLPPDPPDQRQPILKRNAAKSTRESCRIRTNTLP